MPCVITTREGGRGIPGALHVDHPWFFACGDTGDPSLSVVQTELERVFVLPSWGGKAKKHPAKLLMNWVSICAYN